MVVTGWNRPGGGKETGGGDNGKIRAGLGGGGGRGIEPGLGRRGGVSGSKRVEWSVMERGGVRMSDQPIHTMGWRHRREEQSISKNLNLE